MSFVDLVVIGMGMVSPVALTPAEHVFFIRAEGAMSSARAFVDAAGEPLDVLHCPVIDPTRPFLERMAALGQRALEDALMPLAGWPYRAQMRAQACVASPWEAFSAEDAAHCEAAWSNALGLSFAHRRTGAAGIYAALAAAPEALQRASAVVIVAVDSFASPAAIAARLRPPSRWEPVPPRLSEAAVALVVTTPPRASGLDVLGRVRFAATAQGAASDLDDAPIDGRAMAALVREAARLGGAFGNTFGPSSVDNLRRRTWEHGSVRNHGAFALDCVEQCVEHSIGRVGAASGAAHLAYALASQRHRLLAHEGNTLAWTLSREGMCGLGVIAP